MSTRQATKTPAPPMAGVYDLKPRFQKLLRPIARFLAGAGVTANQVTVAALVMCLGAGGAIALGPEARWPLLLLPLVLLIRMGLNAIDGVLAREHGMKSDLGAILNEVGDVVSDAAVYLPLALVPGVRSWAVVLIVVLALIGEVTGVVPGLLGGERRYDGPMGKSDRAFALGAIALVLGLGVPTGIWLDAAFAVITALLIVTIFNRASKALVGTGQ